MSQNYSNHKKVLFRLKRDSEGYPPNDWEALWALEAGEGRYTIDNIPFFVRGISPGDKVKVTAKRNELRFRSVDEFSNHSVVRVIVFDDSTQNDLIERMNQFGCEFEGSHIEGLIAFDIPGSCSYDDIIDFLQKGED